MGFFGTIFGSALTQNIPVVNSENVGNTTGTAPVYSYATLPAAPAQFPIPANGLIPILNGVGYNVRPNRLLLPKVDQFNLSLQQQINQDMTFTIAYVGNVGERVYPGETEGYNINQFVLPTNPADLTAADNPNNPPGVLSQNQRRPFFNRFSGTYNGAVQVCCSQNINYTGPSARETYNALQTTVQQRFAHGFQVLANYTWSRALNYGSTYFAIDPRVEKGPSDTNRNQLFVLSGIYELPFGKDKMFANTNNRWLNYAVGGWQVAGTTTYESGPSLHTYLCGVRSGPGRRQQLQQPSYFQRLPSEYCWRRSRQRTFPERRRIRPRHAQPPVLHPSCSAHNQRRAVWPISTACVRNHWKHWPQQLPRTL